MTRHETPDETPDGPANPAPPAAAEIASLLREMPGRTAPEEARAAWRARKAELLDRIGTRGG